jgi:hypothetical protein
MLEPFFEATLREGLGGDNIIETITCVFVFCEKLLDPTCESPFLRGASSLREPRMHIEGAIRKR